MGNELYHAPCRAFHYSGLRGHVPERTKTGGHFYCILGAYYLGLYELSKVQEIVEVVLVYAIIVGIVFVLWLYFGIKMYHKLKD